MDRNTRTILAILGVVVAIFFVLPSLSGGPAVGGMMGPGMMGPGMMGGWGQGAGWIGGASALFMLLFWAALIGGLVLLVKWLLGASSAGQGARQDHESPVDILKRRYASGEINRAEFEQAMNDLR